MDRPPKAPTAAELQRKLEDRTASLNRHLAAIRQEFAPLAQISGDGVPAASAPSLNATQKAAAALGCALVVGVLVGLRSRKKKLGRPEHTGAAIRLYVDHLLDEAAELTAHGKDPEKALRKVLKRHPAVVQVETLDAPEEHSAMAGVFASMAKAALGYALKVGADWLTAQAAKSERHATPPDPA